MLLASLLVPIAVVAIVVLVQRLRLPAFLAIMATVVVYGIAADMTFQSVGKAFGLGFTAALEQAGLLVVAGALVQALVLRAAARHRHLPLRRARWPGWAARPRAVSRCCSRPDRTRRAGRSGSRSPCWPSCAGRALAARRRRGLGDEGRNSHDGHGSPLPVARSPPLRAGWDVARQVPPTNVPGWLAWTWLAFAIPIALLIVQSVAQMPSEPLGKGGAREFYIGISKPLMLAVLAITLGVLFAAPLAALGAGRPQLGAAAAGGRRGRRTSPACSTRPAWPSCWPNTRCDPRFGLLTPFLAAAIVKTMQGNSLTAVLTASGMVEPMLPALGLDSASGRVLAAAAAGAGSMAICHVNDPFFWIAASMARLSPAGRST